MSRTKLKIVTAGVSVFAFLAVPVTASALTASTTISSQVGSVISLLTSSGTVSIDTTPNGTGVQTIAGDTVTVSTNDSSGYNLTLNETTAVGTLTDGAKTIAATSGTFAAPTALAVNTWGYRVDGAGTFGAGPTAAASNAAISSSITFAKVPATASPDTLKSTGGVATNDVTTVWYSVATNTSTASGTYTNDVTYTATTK